MDHTYSFCLVLEGQKQETDAENGVDTYVLMYSLNVSQMDQVRKHPNITFSKGMFGMLMDLLQIILDLEYGLRPQIGGATGALDSSQRESAENL